MITVIEKSVSNPINEVDIPNRYSLIGLEVDDATSTQLLNIAILHCKLVFEHGKTTTSQERRREVLEEIQSLRITRHVLINQLIYHENVTALKTAIE